MPKSKPTSDALLDLIFRLANAPFKKPKNGVVIGIISSSMETFCVEVKVDKRNWRLDKGNVFNRKTLKFPQFTKRGTVFAAYAFRIDGYNDAFSYMQNLSIQVDKGIEARFLPDNMSFPAYVLGW